MELKSSHNRPSACIAVLGTGSDVGKSIVVTALCRSFGRRGMRVAPFKAQNMSNNSGVTPEGLEMGRAQIVQAEAAAIPPHVDMNPILLKPTSDVGSQVVLLGNAVENSTASEYHRKKTQLLSTATQSLQRLRSDFDIVVLEGAGSCAEVNLMPHDIVNFRMAEAAEAPVVLVADIHRGGVFAQILGTLKCLPPAQQERIAGFIINRFRGDISLFRDGIEWIEQKTDKPVFGVLPWFSGFKIEDEDSVVIENPQKIAKPKAGSPAVAVIRTPHISNFTDFDPLSRLDGLQVCFLEKPTNLAPFQAVILPGSKNTRYDLQWLHDTGWTACLKTHAEKSGNILGICGGYQMMGTTVEDPDGLEGPPGETKGIGLLPVKTILEAPKTTTRTRFTWETLRGSGYEIHMGRTIREGGESLFRVQSRNRISCEEKDGCITACGKRMGTYIHGLFDTPEITSRYLEAIGLAGIEPSEMTGPAARDRDYDLLADHLEKYINVKEIADLAFPGRHSFSESGHRTPWAQPLS